MDNEKIAKELLEMVKELTAEDSKRVARETTARLNPHNVLNEMENGIMKVLKSKGMKWNDMRVNMDDIAKFNTYTWLAAKAVADAIDEFDRTGKRAD